MSALPPLWPPTNEYSATTQFQISKFSVRRSTKAEFGATVTALKIKWRRSRQNLMLRFCCRRQNLRRVRCRRNETRSNRVFKFQSPQSSANPPSMTQLKNQMAKSSPAKSADHLPRTHLANSRIRFAIYSNKVEIHPATLSKDHQLQWTTEDIATKSQCPHLSQSSHYCTSTRSIALIKNQSTSSL